MWAKNTKNDLLLDQYNQTSEARLPLPSAPPHQPEHKDLTFAAGRSPINHFVLDELNDVNIPMMTQNAMSRL